MFTWKSFSARGPVFVRGSNAPFEFFAVEIKGQQSVEPCRCQENTATFANDLVTVLQMTIAKGIHNLEVAVIAEQLVAGIPVDVLVGRLCVEIDRVYATMALALLAATDHRCCD